MHLLFFVPFAIMFLQISNALALSYHRAWDHPQDVCRPNQVLGVICPQNFPGFVTLPGEGQLPELGLSWEHYLAALDLPEEMINGVLRQTRADMVIRMFWVISPLHN